MSGAFGAIKATPAAAWQGMTNAVREVKSAGTELVQTAVAAKLLQTVLRPVQTILKPIVALISIFGAAMMQAMGPALQQLITTLLSPENIALMQVIGQIVGAALVPALAALTLVLELMRPVLPFITLALQLFATGLQIVANVLVWLIDMLKAAWDPVVAFVRGIVNGIISFLNGIITGINAVIQTVTLGTVSNAIPAIPMLAEGGLVTGPTLAMIGEREPEAVIPLSKFAAQQQSKQVTINVTVGGVVDELTVRSIAKKLREVAYYDY